MSAAGAAGTAPGDDGSVSDSAMLFGQLPDDRRRHNDTGGTKSSAASGKTASGNVPVLIVSLACAV